VSQQQTTAPGDDARKPVSGKKLLAVIVAVGLGAWWWSGGLDVPLSSVGLNREPCIKGIAGTFCGDDAERLCAGIAFEAPGCRELRGESAYEEPLPGDSDADGDGISDRHDGLYDPDD
jgi:hypothetical protein